MGIFYKNQDKLVEAKIIYLQALKDKKKTLKLDYTLILNIVNNLGALYSNQDKLVKVCYGGQGCPSQWWYGEARGSIIAGYHRTLIVTEEVLDQFHI